MQKFKVSKIRGIDKNSCTAEQKIAYNYASFYFDVVKKLQNNGYSNFGIMHGIIKEIEKDLIYKQTKYNIDVIIIAFRYGFDEYMNRTYQTICSGYNEIGHLFNIPYEIY